MKTLQGSHRAAACAPQVRPTVTPAAALRAQLAQWRSSTRALFMLAANDAELLAELSDADREDVRSGAACLAHAMESWQASRGALATPTSADGAPITSPEA